MVIKFLKVIALALSIFVVNFFVIFAIIVLLMAFLVAIVSTISFPHMLYDLIVGEISAQFMFNSYWELLSKMFIEQDYTQLVQISTVVGCIAVVFYVIQLAIESFSSDEDY